MNNADRKRIQAAIDKIEEVKGELEPLVEELSERASNMPESFSEKIEKLEEESSNVQDFIDALDSVIMDATGNLIE